VPLLFDQDQLLLLIRLVVSHLIADLFSQAKWSAERGVKKRWTSGTFYVHCASAGILAYLLAARWNSLWLPLVVFSSHLVLDGVGRERDTARSFLLDQLAHLSVILACWILLVNATVWDLKLLLSIAKSSTHLWILTASYIIVIWPAAIWIGKFTEPWRKEIGEGESQGLDKAGLCVGRLERVLILTFVLLGQFGAIGFLIAAKSVFRFGEIRDPSHRKETEYFLIGTAVSFAVAVICGVVAHSLLKSLLTPLR